MSSGLIASKGGGCNWQSTVKVPVSVLFDNAAFDNHHMLPRNHITRFANLPRRYDFRQLQTLTDIAKRADRQGDASPSMMAALFRPSSAISGGSVNSSVGSPERSTRGSSAISPPKEIGWALTVSVLAPARRATL